MLLYFITIFAESQMQASIPFGSHLFLYNGSFLFDSRSKIKMPGHLVTIPTLTTFRIFSIRNIYITNNFYHFLTNSQFRQSFHLNMNNCHFSKFLQSPISIEFSDDCDDRITCDDESDSCRLFLKDLTFCNCSDKYGSAISIKNRHDGNLRIENCSFTNCSSSQSGGALYALNMSNINILKSKFENCQLIPERRNFDYCGGAIYINTISGSTNIIKSNFSSCYSINWGGGGIFIFDSDQITIQDSNFYNCSIERGHGPTFGGGALLLNASQITLHSNNFDECDAFYGSGIAVNLYLNTDRDDLSYEITEVKGAYLNCTNCTNECGCLAFHFTNFSNLNTLSISDFNTTKGDHYLFYLSSSFGKIANTNFELYAPTFTGSFYVNNLERVPTQDPDELYILEIECVNVPAATDFYNLLFIKDGTVSNGIFINITSYIASTYLVPHGKDPGFFNASHYISDEECFKPTPSLTFTPSKDFSITQIFSESNKFTFSSYFEPSSPLSGSACFTESSAFTYTNGFTETQDFSNSYTLSSKSKTISSQGATSNSMYRTPVQHPDITAYNMGVRERDGKGTKTDLGLTTIYICIALLIVMLIIVIVFAVIKNRQPNVERKVRPNEPDEFYFPDFENVDEVQ